MRYENYMTNIKKRTSILEFLALCFYIHRFLIMEKDHTPPHYSSPHMDQTAINYPGQQAAYPSQAGQLIFHFNHTNKNEQDD